MEQTAESVLPVHYIMELQTPLQICNLRLMEILQQIALLHFTELRGNEQWQQVQLIRR